MSTLLDVEPVILDGLDFQVPCVAQGHPADVWVQCRFCEQNAGALCHFHLRFKRAEAEAKAAKAARIQCAGCGKLGSEFDDLFTVVPLS